MNDSRATVARRMPTGIGTWDVFRKRVLPLTAFWVFLIDGVLVIVFGVLSANHVFWSVANFQDLAIDGAEVVLLASGEALLLGAGEFDISLGANIVLSSVLGGEVMIHVGGSANDVANGVYPHLALALTLGTIACLACGAVIGLFNGFVVTALRVNSLIATLGTLGIATGTAYVITSGGDLANLPTDLQTKFGINTYAGIPVPAGVAAVVIVLLALMVRTSRFGMRTLALGSSRVAARRAGLRVERHLVVLFALAGMLAGLAALIDLSRFATTNVSGHQTDALAAIGGAVIGGTSLFGGRVSLIGGVFGAMLAVILQVGLVIVGLAAFYQLIVVGAVLIISVHIDQRRQKPAER